MQILKMTMFETDGASENYVRPYETDMRDTKRIVDDIIESTNLGRSLDTTRLARTASGILMPSTDIIGTDIANGWQQQRIMFAMAVQASDGPISGNRIHYITGYTDHNDYVINGDRVDFPDDMRLYFNSVTRVDVSEMSHRGRRVYRPVVRSNDLMLLRDSVKTHDTRRRSKPFVMRPYDVMSRSSSNNVLSGHSIDDEDVQTLNLTSVFLQPTLLSARSNNDSVEYLSKVMSGYIKSRSHHNDSAESNANIMMDHDDDPDLFGDAAERIKDTNFRNDTLFTNLKRFSDITDDGFITWGLINKIDPDFEPARDLPFRPWKERVRHSNYTRDNLRGDDRYTAGLANYDIATPWHSNTTECLCASMIVRSLPSLMLKSMYSRIDGLVIDTDPEFDNPKVFIGTPQPYVDGIPLEYGYTYFTQYIEDVLIPNISKNGLFRVEALIHANIDQDIEIYIKIDGGDEEYFVDPAWAGHITTSVVTDRESDVHNLSSGLGSLLDEIGINIERNNSRDLIDRIDHSPCNRQSRRITGNERVRQTHDETTKDYDDVDLHSRSERTIVDTSGSLFD